MSRVLLGAGASAALHKAVDLASLLSQRGHELRTVLTPRAAQLVAPQLFEAVSGGSAHVTEFGESRQEAMDHIELARWPELVLIAPCTAALAGRLALGLGQDLLGTLLLALPVGVPRLLAPAMNPAMLANPAVGRNLITLREDGWRVLEPGEGPLACGDEGPGRLPEPDELCAAVEESLRV